MAIRVEVPSCLNDSTILHPMRLRPNPLSPALACASLFFDDEEDDEDRQ
jgi:hypothetical protein